MVSILCNATREIGNSIVDWRTRLCPLNLDRQVDCWIHSCLACPRLFRRVPSGISTRVVPCLSGPVRPAKFPPLAPLTTGGPVPPTRPVSAGYCLQQRCSLNMGGMICRQELERRVVQDQQGGNRVPDGQCLPRRGSTILWLLKLGSATSSFSPSSQALFTWASHRIFTRHGRKVQRQPGH